MNSPFNNWIEIYNEVTAILYGYTSILLLKPSIDSRIRDYLGWISIGIIILNVFINLVAVIIDQISQLWKNFLLNKKIK